MRKACLAEKHDHGRDEAGCRGWSYVGGGWRDSNARRVCHLVALHALQHVLKIEPRYDGKSNLQAFSTTALDSTRRMTYTAEKEEVQADDNPVDVCGSDQSKPAKRCRDQAYGRKATLQE